MQEQLTEAAQVAYSGTDQSSRQSAEAYIEKVKGEKGKGIAEYGFGYAEMTGNVVLQHFGYHLLETAVERHWGEYGSGEVAEWKRRLLDMCGAVQERVIQEKLSKLIGMLCVRIWPQQWAELLPTLSMMWQTSPKSREMAQRVLLSMPQETALHNYKQKTPHEKSVATATGRWDSLHIEADRKSEVLLGLEANALSVLQMTNTYFVESVDAYFANPQNHELATQMELCIELVAEYGTVFSLYKLVLHNLTSWAKLITHPEVCSRIADLLHDLVEATSIPSDDIRDWKPVLGFLSALMNFITTALQRDAAKNLAMDEDELSAAHRFALRLSDVLVAIVKNEVLLEKLVANGHMEVLKNCTVALVMHPAAVIHLHSLTFVKKLLSCPKVLKGLLQAGEGFLLPLLQFINDAHLLRVTGKQEGAAGVYHMLDFEDQEEEYLLHHGVLTSVHKEVAHLINKHCPHATITYLGMLLEELLGSYGAQNPAESKKPAGGGVTHQTQTYCKWAVADQVFTHFVDTLAGTVNIEEHPGIPKDLVLKLQGITLRFIDYSTTDNSILPKYLAILQCLALLLCRNRSDVLGKVIAKLVSLMPFKTDADKTELTMDTVTARRKVHAVLVHLSTVFAQEIEAHIGIILQAWEHQSQAGLTDQEVSLLAESLISLTGRLEGTRRDAVLCKIMEPMMAPWRALQPICTSPPAFQLMVENLLDPKGTRPDLEAARANLKKCLCVFQGVFKRSIPTSSSSSLIQLSGILVSPLLDLAKCINTMMVPGQMAGKAGTLLAITPEEKEQATGGGLTSREHSNTMFLARQYISQVRASVYVLLGSLTAFNSANYSSYMTEVYSRLFIDPLKHIELLHLKYFWGDFCMPFTLLTPADAYGVLAKVFPSVCGFIFERLSRGWMEWCAKEGASSGGAFKSNGKVTTDEGWEYKVLADASSEVVGSFFHVATISQGGLVGNTKLKRYCREPKESDVISSVCVQLCNDTRLLHGMLLLLIGAVSWPSPVSAVRSVEALQKLAPKVLLHASLHPTLVHLLGASLHRLSSLKAKPSSSGANKESQLSNYLINLICELYCGLFQSSSEPAQMLIQLGFAHQTVAELNRSLASEKQVAKRRALFKVLLSPKKGPSAMIGNLPQYDIRAKAACRQYTAAIAAVTSAHDEYDCTLALTALFSEKM